MGFFQDVSVEQATSLGLDASIAGGLCYLFTWVTGLIFFLIEKSNVYVKYNAMQSMLLGASLTIFWIAAIIIDAIVVSAAAANGTFVGFSICTFIVWILSLVLVICCIVFGYQGVSTKRIFKLPLLGNLAYKWTYGAGGASPAKTEGAPPS